MYTEINNALKILKQGGIILYPTDTVWGIGCDATNFDAIEKIYKLKKRNESKSLICLVSDLKMLNYYIQNIPEAAYDILKYADKPTTIIYDKPVRVAKNLIAKNNTLAIRIVKDGFSNQLIRKLRQPIVSTSANISGKPTPKSFKKISQEILKGVDYVVNLPHEKKTIKPSSIIKLTNDGKVTVIRK
ncbi:threonylcarbamoyl-AMP synthase [Flavobacteriaceae bacterium AH-315-B10]|nr:threonylcarbamoyl-AMP synthase [Flavobacteriaceae bacterium AH-315-B10]